MQFQDVGTHCSFAGCHQRDFLPFTCDRCGLVFCLDHRREADHDCQGTRNASRQVLVCPICSQSMEQLPGEDPNAAFARHAASGRCKREAAGREKCVACKRKLDAVNRFVCPLCNSLVCTAHRYMSDHT
eukprot:g18995.t1